MILHDIMVGYDFNTGVYKFYFEGKQIEVRGGMAYHQICLLLANAVAAGKKEGKE